ncbi:uncharacterized protein LOC135110613 [Scylla paramamosain]|uniref:uncharacterized protein LOC135110613 n=1 Tax=Scylla paramamosain TaxID=85552 RepID=UPI0030834E15
MGEEKNRWFLKYVEMGKVHEVAFVFPTLFRLISGAGEAHKSEVRLEWQTEGDLWLDTAFTRPYDPPNTEMTCDKLFGTTRALTSGPCPYLLAWSVGLLGVEDLLPVEVKGRHLLVGGSRQASPSPAEILHQSFHLERLVSEAPPHTHAALLTVLWILCFHFVCRVTGWQ